MSDRNMELSTSAGSFISSPASPWALGADFNVEPGEVQRSQFALELCGALVAPAVCARYPAGPPFHA
eukprot:4535913-Pyramimonas_sp.AAC.1